MNISQLIQKLQNVKTEYGDLEVLGWYLHGEMKTTSMMIVDTNGKPTQSKIAAAGVILS